MWWLRYKEATKRTPDEPKLSELLCCIRLQNQWLTGRVIVTVVPTFF